MYDISVINKILENLIEGVTCKCLLLTFALEYYWELALRDKWLLFLYYKKDLINKYQIRHANCIFISILILSSTHNTLHLPKKCYHIMWVKQLNIIKKIVFILSIEASETKSFQIHFSIIKFEQLVLFYRRINNMWKSF